MTTSLKIAALALAASLAAFPLTASAQTAPKTVDPAIVDAYVKSTFGSAPQEWQERIVPDETLKVCNKYHNNVPSAEADAITRRELAKVVYPADGNFLGDWKSGAKIANNGRGGQFSDPPGTVAGGNCYACHQMERKEVSFGTLGPSLTNYGKDRKFAPEEAKMAYTKIFDSQAVFACSNMPRFGANKVLSEQQIKDIIAFLFDPESPVNK
ncbi:MAG: sulfur oxidation c-type cytochrome SoxX [Afipia sp.]|jgi:sulfur-oxidizing protein SoxX|nr:sulfur oxidation c-type cytochrome SoxX [Afipia sp.]